MVVYWEYAFAENCLLDGLMLYLALRCAKGEVGAVRLLFAAAVGGGEALLFPVLPLPAWCAVLVKVLGGILLAVLAVKRGAPKTYFVVLVSFFALTFALGGALTALCGISGIGADGLPAGLVLGGAGVFFLLSGWAVRRFFRYARTQSRLFPCTVKAGGRTIRIKGFSDSGNCLYFRGKPVNVLSATAALALFSGVKPAGRMTVSTVHGSRESPVFRSDELSVGGKPSTGAYFTVGEVGSRDYQMILHTAFVEAQSETDGFIKGLVEKTHGR